MSEKKYLSEEDYVSSLEQTCPVCNNPRIIKEPGEDIINCVNCHSTWEEKKRVIGYKLLFDGISDIDTPTTTGLNE